MGIAFPCKSWKDHPLHGCPISIFCKIRVSFSFEAKPARPLRLRKESAQVIFPPRRKKKRTLSEPGNAQSRSPSAKTPKALRLRLGEKVECIKQTRRNTSSGSSTSTYSNTAQFNAQTGRHGAPTKCPQCTALANEFSNIISKTAPDLPSTASFHRETVSLHLEKLRI